MSLISNHVVKNPCLPMKLVQVQDLSVPKLHTPTNETAPFPELVVLRCLWMDLEKQMAWRCVQMSHHPGGGGGGGGGGGASSHIPI